MKRKSIGAFIGGMLVANSAPHLATAITGREHLTPLAGRRSGPAVNLIWGLGNLVGGLALAKAAMKESGPDSDPRRWDGRLHAFEAGAVTFAAWMFVTERLMPVNARPIEAPDGD